MAIGSVGDIAELAAAAEPFKKRLDRIKDANSAPGFCWYPYDTFAVLPVLNSMLRGERRDLLALAQAAPILDIGCGDGALSFFFESMGCLVKAIDYPGPNFNGTLGFDRLKCALASSVELDNYDVDTGLRLDGRTYGLALCLGVLYHLKNPLGFLETLSRHARYCLLSTRIAEVTVRGTPIREEPVAFLLDTAEANHDATNYWIFSEGGLRRILSRTGWDICDYATTGTQTRSDPSRSDRDQRAFCMARSKRPDPWSGVDLAGGWHELENDSWRWTARAFSVQLSRKPFAGNALLFRFTAPAHVLEAVGPLSLHAIVCGVRLPATEYREPGECVYRQPLPEAVAGESRLSIQFELDKAITFGVDHRELGVQVVFWASQETGPQMLSPITVE